MKKVIWLFLAIVMVLCSGCGASPGSDGGKKDPYTTGDGVNLPDSGGYPLTIKDYFDVETTLEKMPEKVAVLSGSMLNIWYDLGGKSVCTSDISSNIKIDKFLTFYY